MKVVALVSGGKDSCYAMMRCIHFGHEIVALANLLPEDDTVDELDSYMYQTVGHQIVEAYAQCMGLPLFRKRIQGKPKSFELRYTETDGDEVEDLELLLRQVKENIPEVDAVSTGAIASNYQRLRVENICSRLGLVSLAYLWMQDQAELLQQMVESGITAVLVKVAAMGLHPHKHLGKEISTMSPVLAELHEKYGCNVCGEGGEYETLTLDCPLFENARIVLDGYNIVLASAESVVQVAYLRPVKFHLEPKTSSVPAGVVHWVPDILKENEANPRLVNKENKSLCLQDVAKCHVAQSTHHVSINCWRISTPDEGAGAAGELDILLRLVQTYLVKEGLEWADVLYIHLYIRNMKDFALINSVYAQHITEQDCPRGAPSRSTVEVPLCNGEVMVEVLASRKKAKQVLHVQSISCWAPSCIGPYSQATLHGSLLFMAGQIGLDPPTMVLLSGGAGAEMHQCLLNAEAVAGSYGSKLTASSLSLTIYLSTMQRSDVEKCLLSFFASGSLPLVLFVLVSGLPKGASVEVEPLLLCSDETGVRKTFVHDVPSSDVGYSSESGDLVCTSDCYTVPGHLCRALVSIDYETWKVYKHESGVKLFTWLMELLNHTLKDADLQWSDVLAFRVYYMQSEPGVLDDLEQGIGVHLPTPLMVPVHGLGHDSELKSVFTFDILARNEAA